MSHRGKTVFVCLLLVIVCFCFQARPAKTARHSPANTALQGEAAIQQLKTDGGYASLAAAMAVIRDEFDDEAQAVAPVTSDSIPTQQQKLTAADGAVFNRFGSSVALSGNTLVVGAPLNRTGANVVQGSAYVFTRSFTSSGAVWMQQQKLIASDGATGDEFGSSVAVSGDTIVVGAPFDTIGPNMNQGSAYVFTRSGTVWTQQQPKFTALDGTAGDFFGGSVAISGGAVLVGAPYDDVGANGDQGSVYSHTRSGAVWTQLKFTARDGGASDRFGSSIALSGDAVVVGAPLDTIGANNYQGSAYVFTRGREGENWIEQQKLTAADGAAGDVFGSSVALSGDTVVVGAEGYGTDTTYEQGSAYVFTRGFPPSGATWTQQQKLTANDGASEDVFGHSVALSGDTVVVGASSNTIGANGGQGSAYVFTRGGALWTQQQPKLTADDGAASDHFGRSLALSGDTLVVGAPFDDIGANTDQGSVYVLVSPACPTVTLNPSTFPVGQTGVLYGQTMTASGGAAPYSFAVTAGALPGGLTLTPAGALRGTPTQAGAFNFTVRATDANGCTGARAYTLTIQSPGCNYSVAPANHFFPSGGADGTANVTAGNGCTWEAVSHDPWILITSGATGSGNGAVRFAVPQNPNPVSRQGALTIAGRRVTVVQAAPVASVSAASFVNGALAAESIAAAFGNGLAQSTKAATTQPLPTTLAGTKVGVMDTLGVERFAPLFFVSPTQVNFQVPPGTAAGKAQVTILRDDERVAAGSAAIAMISPGLFSANASGQGAMIGVALRVKADGSQSYEPVVRFDDERGFVPVLIDLGPASDRVFLVLFATGVRHRSSLGAVSVKVGGVNADVFYAGPQGSFAGLDQINVLLPRSLAGRGSEMEVSVTVDGMAANPLKAAIR